MIQSLNLNNNRLAQLPDVLCMSMGLLTHLRLDSNNIAEIPDRCVLGWVSDCLFGDGLVRRSSYV